MNKQTEIHAIGCMSGTSQDGLDLAWCKFSFQEPINSNTKYQFEILAAETIEYPAHWLMALSNAHRTSAYEFVSLHRRYGTFIGQNIQMFAKKHNISNVDFVASHGHTIFHEPQNNISFQIGDPAAIAAAAKQNVFADFRTFDINLGGQGAPLVPIGDHILFSEYDYCLNLGGYANISYQKDENRIAFDIAPANAALNYFAKKMGKDFDINGTFGRNGTCINDLLKQLNNIAFYHNLPPKSLGFEWFKQTFLPICDPYSDQYSDIDILATLYEHIAIQIAKAMPDSSPEKSVLITGGGAHNKFLIEKIKQHTQNQIIVPDKLLVDFKEALIFAFLGLLNKKNQINTLKTVTGATINSIGGVEVKYKPAL